MRSSFLLIVEGKKTEPNIFQSILLKYGYNVIKYEEKLNIDLLSQFDEANLEKDNKNVIIVQGPRNRIHDLLKYYNENEDSFEKMLSRHSELFQGIFLMYDVDHNDCDDIEEIFNKFNDESTGMLLLSSPCIEVLGDYNHDRKESKYNHLYQYKKELNNYYQKNKTDLISYIIDNFEELSLYYLKKNKDDFNENNIMEHPRLVIDYINKYNERVNYSKDSEDESYVIYRYFTTVVYVFIAYINGLVREIDNYDIVYQWLLKRSNMQKL